MWAYGERRWRLAVPIGFAAVVVAVALFAPLPAAMAADGVTAQIAPTTVTLAPGDAVRVGLVLSNSASAPVTITRIDVATPPRLVAGITTDPAVPTTIPAGSSIWRELELRARPGLQDGEVAVVTEYLSGTSTLIVTAALTVAAADATAQPEVAFVVAPAKVNDGQSRDAVVRIANPSPVAYEKVRLLAIDSDDLHVELHGDPRSPFTACVDGASTEGSGRAVACLDKLAPGASQLLDLRIRANDSVRTGMQKVGIRFTGTPTGMAAGPPAGASPAPSGSPSASASPTGSSPSAGASPTAGAAPDDVLPAANVVGTAEVQLAVFGVDALSPLGVGTLFVLPGFLAVLVFLLLGRYVYPRRPALPDTVDLNDLRALPVVVPVAALTYLLAWVLWGRNLTVKVGTLDVALLLGLGFLLGFLVWAVMAGTWYERVGRKQFSLTDDWDMVLKRLAARKSRLALPEVVVNNVRHLYLARGAGGKLLVSPQLAYTVLGDPQAATTKDHDKAFRDAMRQNDIRAVLAAKEAGWVKIWWDGPSNLTEVDEGVQLAGNQDLLVER